MFAIRRSATLTVTVSSSLLSLSLLSVVVAAACTLRLLASHVHVSMAAFPSKVEFSRVELEGARSTESHVTVRTRHQWHRIPHSTAVTSVGSNHANGSVVLKNREASLSRPPVPVPVPVPFPFPVPPPFPLPRQWHHDLHEPGGDHQHHHDAAGASVLSIPITPADVALSSDQRAILVDLFVSTGGLDNGAGAAGSGAGTGWVNSWNESMTTARNIGPAAAVWSECSWVGITCDPTSNAIIGLALDYNNLVGTLPWSLGGFTALQSLSLTFNSLSGTIPDLFKNLTQLTSLSLLGNRLSGPFPPSLCFLVNLQWFDLSTNLLSGPLPPCIGYMTALQWLYISNNQMNGTLPESIGYLPLSVVDLSRNKFSGEIPYSFVNLQTLTAALFHHNMFSGPLPLTQLVLGSSLRLLDLGSNQFNILDCSEYLNLLDPPISPLADLIIRNNSLSVDVVTLLTCLGTLTPNVSLIDASLNKITWDGSPFPSTFPGNYLLFIYTLTLTHNLLQGSADYFMLQMFWLGQLFYLDLSFNVLNGSIPAVVSQFLQVGFTGNPVASYPVGYSSSNDNQLRGAGAGSGPGPASGSRYPAATTLVSATGVGSLTSSCSSEIKYEVPAWVGFDMNTLLQNNTLNMTCPNLVGVGECNLSLDASYLHYQHCQCQSGYVRGPDRESCVPCPPHVLCSRVMYAPLHAVEPGYYPWPLSSQQYGANSNLLIDPGTVFLSCDPAGVCNPNGNKAVAATAQYECATDSAVSSSSAVVINNQSVFTCATGHDPSALLCSQCEDGYFMWHDYCTLCGNATVALPVALLVVGLTVLYVLIALFVREHQAVEQTLPGGPRNADSEPPRSHQQMAVVKVESDPSNWAVSGVVLFWLQALSVLQQLNNGASGSATGGSSSLLSLGLVGTFLRFSPVGLQCFSRRLDWSVEFWVFVFSPLWIAALVALIYQLMKFPSFWAAVGGVRTADDSVKQAACFSLLQMMWSVVYMQVAIFVFQSWRCTTITSGNYSNSYVVAAPYVECYTPEHNAMVFIGVLFFLFFIIALPALTFWLSWHDHQNDLLLLHGGTAALPVPVPNGTAFMVRAKSRVSLSVGVVDSDNAKGSSTWSSWIWRFETNLFEWVHANATDAVHVVFVERACEQMKAELFWWQLVLSFRKLLLTSIVYLISPQSSVLPVLVLWSLSLLVCTHAWNQPYRRNLDNALEAIFVVHIAAFYVVTILTAQARLASDVGAASPTVLSVAVMEAFGYFLEAFGLFLLVGIGIFHLHMFRQLRRQPQTSETRNRQLSELSDTLHQLLTTTALSGTNSSGSVVSEEHSEADLVELSTKILGICLSPAASKPPTESCGDESGVEVADNEPASMPTVSTEPPVEPHRKITEEDIVDEDSRSEGTAEISFERIDLIVDRLSCHRVQPVHVAFARQADPTPAAAATLVIRPVATTTAEASGPSGWLWNWFGRSKRYC